MKKIGPTVREIRKIKGLTSLEVYSGIISKSFASRFENGINEIGSEKLFMVLDNLSMSADEFRFIQNDYHQSKSQELRHQLDAAYDVHNLQVMGKIINENKNSSQPNFRSIAVTGQILLDAYHSKDFVVTSAMNDLWNKLFQSKTWTIQEIKDASILLPIAASKNELSMIPKIVNRFENNCQNYILSNNDPFHITDALMGMYLSLIQIQLNIDNPYAAKKLLTKVTSVNRYNLTWNGRLSEQVIIAIWNLYFGNPQKANKIINTLKNLEELYSPAIDHNLLAILKVRQKLAEKYRREQKND